MKKQQEINNECQTDAPAYQKNEEKTAGSICRAEKAENAEKCHGFHDASASFCYSPWMCQFSKAPYK